MLKQKFKDTDIVLASGSPRRQELLKGLDIDFRIETRPVEEVYKQNLKGGEITTFLSKLKASEFQDLQPHQLIITSDTIVWLDDRALGKPKDEQDAISMLTSMSDQMHEVYTSVCFTTAGSQEVITDVTKVYFKPLTHEEIKYYVQTYKPFDRAGAYGIQDWIGYSKIDKLEGCYYNVMGLPLPKVYEWLKDVDL